MCRPPRDIYTRDDLIGREEGFFYLGNTKFVREDLVLQNEAGLDLQCSLYRQVRVLAHPHRDCRDPCSLGSRAFRPPRPRGKSDGTPLPPQNAPADGAKGSMPCVVYCHCNSGSRRDAEEALLTLLPVGVSVFALDFSGSGLSGGQWVTLGESTAIAYQTPSQPG